MKTVHGRQPAGAPAAAPPPEGERCPAEVKVRRLRAAQHGKLLRAAVAEAFEEILGGFLEQAKRGSCQHMKMVLELMEPKQRAPVEQKGSAQCMVEEFERQVGPLQDEEVN